MIEDEPLVIAKRPLRMGYVEKSRPKAPRKPKKPVREDVKPDIPESPAETGLAAWTLDNPPIKWEFPSSAGSFTGNLAPTYGNFTTSYSFTVSDLAKIANGGTIAAHSSPQPKCLACHNVLNWVPQVSAWYCLECGPKPAA